MCFTCLRSLILASRRRHTRYWRDWSSDVCSSDLTVNKKLLKNLSIPLYQIMPPYFATIFNKDFEGIKYDLEGAKKLLDEAGYKDTNGDGVREDKKGQPLKIKFAAMQGGATQEPTVSFYVQQWKAIGLDVELVTGRLIEFNAFYEKLESDDPEIDVYMAAWNTGTNPDPTGFHGKHELYNMMRFTSDRKSTRLNSSHANISYAVFCLKKKKMKYNIILYHIIQTQR